MRAWFTFPPSLSPLISYDHPHVIAGQGTAALEILSQLEQLGASCDAVVIPVGGGGLLAGMAIVLKHFVPNAEVIVSRVSIF